MIVRILKVGRKMDLSFYMLSDRGLTKANLKSLLESTISFIDLVIEEKREEIIKNTKKKSLISKTVNLISEFGEENISVDIFNSPLILLNFGASLNKIQRGMHAVGINGILEFVRYVERMKFDLTTPQKRLVESIKIYQEWIEMNTQSVNRHKILYTLFQLKSCRKESILQIFSNDEDTLVSLIQEEYIIQVEDMLYFPSNIFYSLPNSVMNTINKKKAMEQEKQQEQQALALHDVLLINTKEALIFKKRVIEGKTLQEIGDELGISRERVRQIQKKFLKSIGPIKEFNKYQEVFETFFFEADDFQLLFAETFMVYSFLNIVCNKGDKDAKEFVLKTDFPVQVKQKYFENNGYLLTRNGKLIRPQKNEFFDELLFKNKLETFTPETFYEIYKSEVSLFNRENLLIESPRAIEGVVQRSNFAISSYGRRFRYYDFNIGEENNNLLKKFLQLPKGIYSMYKIYNDNREFMMDIGINDEYELHSLYRVILKNQNMLNIKLNRSPEFVIGKVNKLEFIQNLMDEFSGEKLDNLVEYLFQVYGLRKNSMESYIQMNFRHLIDNHCIRTEYHVPENEQLLYLQQVMNRNLYLRDEVEQILNDTSLIGVDFSNLLMNDLGYYVTGDAIFKKEFGNVKSAVASIVLKNDRYIKGCTYLECSNLFSGYVSALERDLLIVCISDDIYLSVKYLEDKGISKNLLLEFVDEVIQFVKSTEIKYFTISLLVKKGFASEVIDLGFEDIFYDRLLLTQHKELRPITRNTPVIFTISESSKVTLEKFLSDELVAYPSPVILDDFLDDILYKYNQEFDRDRVKAKLRNYGIYYSSEMNKLYFDKDDYYNEVYGK